MALSFEYQRPAQMTRTGVALWLMPALVSGLRSTDPVEVARAPDSGGSPGTWVTLVRLDPLPSQGRAFVDTRPWTTALWWYRSRHVRADGAVASAWTVATQHTVKMLPQNVENVAEQKLGAITLAQDADAKLVTDFGNALITVTDNQATPKVRAKLGKVGAGLPDYGVQVFDQDGATVADFTGAKRILAVPVQGSVDSGSSLTVDLSTGLTQQVRLNGSLVTLTLSNAVNGGRYRIWFQQDTVGSRPFPKIKGASNDEIVMFTNDTPPVLTTTPGALDLFEFEYRTTPTKRFTCMALQANVLLPTPTELNLTTTAFSSATTSHNVNMPATVNAGELLLMIFVHRDAATPTTPGGWSAIGTVTGTQARIDVFAKVAIGDEEGTTVNVITSATAQGAAHVYRITRWYGQTSGVTFTSASGTGTAPDPASITPATVDRYLYIAVAGVQNQVNVTVYPTNYTNGTETDSGGALGCTLGSARRVLYASSENPGAFTTSASNNWAAATVAVRPLD